MTAGSHPDATGFHPGLAAIHLRIEVRVNEEPYKAPHGQPSKAVLRVVTVNRAQQTDVGEMVPRPRRWGGVGGLGVCAGAVMRQADVV